MQRVIFHIDMDAFFASVEQRDNPAYKGKPVIVGAKPGFRGVVSAASYEARKFGVHSAMPINEAYRRCPQGIFVTPRMSVYEEVSDAIIAIFNQYTPCIEKISIDEAFLDMSGTEKIFGSSMDAARKLSAQVRKEQDLTASVGIAPNKFLAKIASDMNKPNGITMVPFAPEKIVQWLSPLKIEKMWGVGKKSAEIFAHTGVTTIGELQELSLEYLQERFGKQGVVYYYLSRGIDDRPVGEDGAVKSISREKTFNTDTSDREVWKKTLHALAQDVARRARQYGVKGYTVFLTYRTPDFSRHTRQKSLSDPTNIARVIYEQVLPLLDQVQVFSLRLIGLGITKLDEELQTSLFDVPPITKKLEISEAVADKIRQRFGSNVLRKGLEIDDGKETGNDL